MEINRNLTKGLHPSKQCPTADWCAKSVQREVMLRRTAVTLRLVGGKKETLDLVQMADL